MKRKHPLTSSSRWNRSVPPGQFPAPLPVSKVIYSCAAPICSSRPLRALEYASRQHDAGLTFAAARWLW
eukprot:2103649-Lingulodinium_polyedra.AAC.1